MSASPEGSDMGSPDHRRMINQMRIWELEQKDVVPQGLLAMSPRGRLQVRDLAGLCEVDSDPLAVSGSGSVVPVVPTWLREFLIAALRGDTGRPPICCKILCGALAASAEEDPTPTPLSVSLVRTLVEAAIGHLRIVLSDIRVVAKAAARRMPLDLCVYASIKARVEALESCSDPAQMPDMAGRVVRMLQLVVDGEHGVSVVALRHGLDAAVEHYDKLLSKLETVNMWAGQVLANFDSSLKTSGSDIKSESDTKSDSDMSA